jgi:hypothetical protein
MTTTSLVLALFIAGFGSFTSSPEDATVTVIRDDAGVISRALALIGRLDQRVILFDPERYDSVHRRKLQRLEAFVFAERTEIYLNLRGRAYREAAQGRPHSVYILAAILGHEVAHLQGKDERAALVEERNLIYGFMKHGQIPAAVAQAHLENVWQQRQ